VMMCRWRMLDEPRDADQQQDQHEDDEDPQLDRGILPPLDPPYPLA
jgi:hypothetical protein